MATSPDAPLNPSPLAAGANAADTGVKSLRERISSGLARLTSNQKIALMVGLAAIIAIVIGSLLYGSTPAYKVLFSNLSEKDGGAIISSLEQMNTPYKFSESGGAILVPADKVHEARLRLATQGLPKGGSVGFELMENQKFGISQFLEQVNYQRALEGELARTIQTVGSVQMARVHLAIPKPSVFVREEQKPTASVMLQLYPGRQLEPQQIAGITHLVASSIPQLPVANIAIVDQNGTLLSQLKSPLGEAGLDPTQLKYIRDVEASVIKRIQEILSPITGNENVRVQAAADIDFSLQEQTAESFKPNAEPTAASIRSQQSSEQAQASPNPLGVPGALTNQPPAPASAPLTSPAVAGAGGAAAGGAANAQGRVNNAGITAQISNVGQPLSARKDSTINYEVDRTITHTKNQLGRVKRLSVAVLVNHKPDKDKSGKVAPRPLTDAEIKQLNELARDAMGFSQQRGDTLTVVNSSFSPAKEEVNAPFWQHPEFFEFVKELAKYALIAGVVMYIVLSVIRPLVRQMFPPETAKAAAARAAGFSTTDEAGEEESSAEEEEMNMAYATYERKLAKAKEIAIQDPMGVANILREWISPNG